MRIGVDGQTLVSPDADRGIGNYVTSLIEAFSKVPDHEFRLLTWGGSSHKTPPSGSISCARLVGAPLDPIPGLDTPFHRRNAAIRRYARREKLDLLFNPNPLQMGVEAVSRPNPIPLVATVHDLTPFALPDLFMSETQASFARRYRERVEHLCVHADHLIADSAATRDDIIKFLDFPADRISVVHCGIAPEFNASAPQPGGEVIGRLGLGPNVEYLLFSGGINPKKNFPRLFEALGLLDPRLLAEHPLVMAGPINDAEWTALESLRCQYCPAFRTIRAGYVTNESLAELYRGAAALVFVSLHEGFGLPVVEAMACGCPVVAADTGSLPEIAAGAALLCDPRSPESIAEVLTRLLSTPQLRKDMVLRGIERAKAFAWDKAALEMCAIFDQVARCGAISNQSPSTGSKPKLAWVSPLPPAPGGVSAYSAALLRLIRHESQISIITGQNESELPHDFVGIPRISPSDFTMVAASDLVIANMCNNAAQGAAPYEWIARHRCVTIVHDLNIHGFLLDHLVRGPARTPATREQYRRDLALAHGDAGADEARHVLDLGQLPDIPRFPCHRILTHRSRAVIASSAWAASRLENNADRAPVFYLPLGIEHPLIADEVLVEELRRSYAVKSGGLIIVCAGFLEPSRRIDVVIASLAELTRSGIDTKLILAGKVEQSHREWLGRVAEAHQVRGRVEFLDYLTRDEEFIACLAAADVVVHLRHPTNGESSATVLRALSLGRAVITSNSDSYRELPDECCWKVDADKTEQVLLTEYLKTLSNRPDVRRVMGELARDYIACLHSWPSIAARFNAIIHEVASLPDWTIRQ